MRIYLAGCCGSDDREQSVMDRTQYRLLSYHYIEFAGSQKKALDMWESKKLQRKKKKK